METKTLPGAPLLLQPLLVERPWGNQRLARLLGKPAPLDRRIGESWETANEARIASGPLAGRTLRELVEIFGETILGRRGLAASAPFGDFPLLIKFIDANDVLSVQVHPDDDQARPLGQRGKTEAWHILAAEPNAELIVGLREPLTSATLRDLLAQRKLANHLQRLPVRAGDTVFVPAGTLHAIGAGVLLYEIQEQSDITYRLYDWDRVDAAGHPRPLHIEEGLAVLRPERRAQRIQPLALEPWRTILAACRYFLLERWDVRTRHRLSFVPDETFRLASCIRGALTIAADERPPLPLSLGQTALIPASSHQITVEGSGTLLVASIPDLQHDVIAPLRAAGYADPSILQVGGETEDLATARTVAHP